MSTRPPRPPALAAWLLARLLPPAMRDFVLGDLHECFTERAVAAADVAGARLWYWQQTFRVLLAARRPSGTDRPNRQPEENGMFDFLNDIHHAWRLCARRPGFALLTMLTLAIGIGTATAIFSTVDPILFAALPYPGGQRVVVVWERDPTGGKSNIGFPTFDDVARANRSFEAIAAMSTWQPTVTGRAEPERLDGQRVSSSFFRVLGVRPALGRDFAAAEDVRGGDHVVILSQALWRRRFGGDSALVGHEITLSGHPFTVIGIMPERFDNVLEPKAQLWTPLQYDLTLSYACRTCRHLRVLARLRAEITPAQAEREMNALSAEMVRAHPRDYPEAGMLVVPLQQEISGAVRPALLPVLGASALVLLIACVNVTNLLLARGTQREGEFALRAALGASRMRITRQLLTESVLLATGGGLIGIAVALVAVRALKALSPADLPRLSAIAVDGRVLAFALALTMLVGVLSGLVPAVHASRGELHEAIKRGSRRTAGGARRTRATFVVSEVALALLLLVGAGLLLRSLGRLMNVAPGFDTDRLLTMRVDINRARFKSDTAVWTFYDRALSAARSVPGVTGAAWTSQLPLSDDQDESGVHIEDKPRANPEEDANAHRYAVSPGYLELMHIPLVRGRSITERDGLGQPAVAVISQSLARRAWPGEDPIGRRIRVGGIDEGPWRTIVGIVGDVKQLSLAADQPDAVYLPESQWIFADGALSLVARGTGDVTALAPALRDAVWSIDRDQPISRVVTMDRLLSATGAQRRFALRLFEAFALVALLLAGAGLYGVLAGSVAERMREIGVRTALGASRRDILGLVVGEGLSLAALGVVVGAAGAMMLTRLFAALLFDLSPLDPVTYVAVVALLMAVATGACWIPARRAAGVDPAITLRSE